VIGFKKKGQPSPHSERKVLWGRDEESSEEKITVFKKNINHPDSITWG